MNKITIIIPIHKFDIKKDKEYLLNALQSVEENKSTFSGQLIPMIVCPSEIEDTIKSVTDVNILINNGDTDFCSQINFAVENIETPYFSILEFDDIYTSTWFKSVQEYYYTHEDVSVFLPINIQYEETNPLRQYCNELVWANEFSNELGFIDFDCLENFYGFNLTGGVICTEVFKKIGGFKPSIALAFNYEFLLRLTNKKLKVFVVPKEGYCHVINRKGSLTEFYSETMTATDSQLWFNHAKNEYGYTNDRKTSPDKLIEKKAKDYAELK